MDEYSRGTLPLSSQYRKDPRGLVDAKPLFGGEKRKGYPRGVSSREEEEYERIPKLPSEPILMDQDPPTGEGANDERFVDEVDKMPIKRKPEPLGPHNMQGRVNSTVYDVVSRQNRFRKLRV